MPDITAEMVRSLREKTDLPMMDCKKALTEANGNEEQAIKILKERVKNFIMKSGDRVTSEGRVATLTAKDGSSAVMIEVQCESAPVSRSEDFVFLCDQLTKQLLNGPGAASPEALIAQPAPDKPGTTLGGIIEDCMNRLREKLVVARILKLDGPVVGYTHHDGTLGVLLRATGDKPTADVLKDVAMHIAALNPKFCLSDEMDPAIVAAEKEKEVAEAKKSGKPDSIIEKIVAGKMRVFFAKEGVLVDQPFAKDDSKSVEKALADSGLKAVSFTRWRLGQP